MSQEIASPLADIIRKAAERKVEGPLAQMRKRFDKASDALVIVADVSGSMQGLIGSLNMSKWDQLKVALDDICKAYPGVKIIAFGSQAKFVQAGRLPGPNEGSTELGNALKLAATLKPRKTIVISDGQPTDHEAAILDVAAHMTGAIDTIYCGPENDLRPIEFLKRLAKDTGGIQTTWTGYRELSGVIRGMLPAPSK